MVLATTGTALARHSGNRGLAKVEGTITSVSTSPATVTITPNRAGATPVTLQITAATKIEADDDDDGTLADLQTGLQAEAKYDPQTLVAAKIEVDDDEDDDDEDEDDEDEIVARVLTATFDSATGTGTVA